MDERIEPKSSFVEELKELQKLDPKYADRYFDLNEKQANHKMDIEKSTLDHERKDSRLRWWTILITRLLLSMLSAYLLYLEQIGAGYSLAAGVAGSFIPLAYQSWLTHKKKVQTNKNTDP